MTTQDKLLRAILERPHDDLPRRVYADVLEERGQEGDREYAEFIRRSIDRELQPNCHRTRKREVRPSSELCPCEVCDNWRHIEYSNVMKKYAEEATALGCYVIINRGFPAKITTTMAAFRGGPCERCGGLGEDRPPSFGGVSVGKCLVCFGGRRAPGLVDVIGSKWPVTKINFSDKQPFPYGADNVRIDRWGWFRQVITDDESILSNDLWSRMKGHRIYIGEPHSIKWYNSRESAINALSAVAVSLMRKRARLN